MTVEFANIITSPSRSARTARTSIRPSAYKVVLLVLCIGVLALTPGVQCATPKICESCGVSGSRERERQRGTSRVVPDGNIRELSAYSVEEEAQLGDRLSRKVECSTGVLSDRVVERYLTGIVIRLLAVSKLHLAHPPRIRVLNDEEINAHSVPGHLYVNAGLMLAVQSEDELAGAIAHELGHISAHDTMRTLLRSKRGLPMQPFKRSSEFDADRVATELMYLAGYDPQEFAHLLDRAGGEQDGDEIHSTSLDQTLDAYPPVRERARQIENAVPQLASTERRVLDTSRFQEIRLRVLFRFTHGSARYNSGWCSQVAPSFDVR